MKAALKAKDAAASSQCWNDLRHNNILHQLETVHVEQLFYLLVEELRSSKEDVDRDFMLLEQVALTAVAAGITDPLEALMLMYIRRQNPEAAIALYQRFMSLVRIGDTPQSLVERPGEQEEVQEEQDQGGEAYDALALESITRLDSAHSEGRMSIFLAVVSAHAMRDSFADALQAYLEETDVPLHRLTSQTSIASLGHDVVLRQKTTDFIQRLRIAAMVARPSMLSEQIAKAPTLVWVEKLYNEVLHAVMAPGAYIASDSSRTDPNKLVSLTETIWASFLAAFLRFRRTDLASQLWNRMSQLGVPPGLEIWNTVLEAHSAAASNGEALSAWKMMRAKGLQPDYRSYCSMISLYLRQSNLDAALIWFKNCERDNALNSSQQDQLYVHNVMLEGLLACRGVREGDALTRAIALLRKMEKEGPMPDLVSYNLLLKHYGRHCDLGALAATVNRMTTAKIIPDAYSCSTILSSLLRAGKGNDAYDIMLSLMRKQGIRLTAAMCTDVIHRLLRERDEKQLITAIRILHRMEQDPSLQPNVITYTAVLTGLYRNDWLSPKAMEQYRTDIVAQIKKRNLKLTTPAYNALIKASLLYAQPEGLRDSIAYYHEMLRNKVPLTRDTWYILLAGLVEREEWMFADEVVADMVSSGIAVGSSVKNLVYKIRNRQRERK